MITTWMAIWFFIISPTAAQYENGRLDQFLAAAYPVGDLVILGGIFTLLVRSNETTVRSMLILYLTGLLLNVAGDLAYAYTSLQGTYVSGGWMDISWIVAYWFFALAAVRQEYRKASRLAELSAEGIIVEINLVDGHAEWQILSYPEGYNTEVWLYSTLYNYRQISFNHSFSINLSEIVLGSR
jgi:hypothetical protein